MTGAGSGGSGVPEDAGQPGGREREYYFLQQRVGEYHAYCLEMKKWSVAGASAVVVAGQAALLDPLAVFAVMTTLALAFWVTETAWRVDQWVFIRMIQRMEAVHDGMPNVGRYWSRFARGREVEKRVIDASEESWDKDQAEFSRRRFIHHMFQFRALLPHALIVAIGAALMVAAGTGALKRERVDAPRVKAEGPVQLQLPQQGNRH